MLAIRAWLAPYNRACVTVHCSAVLSHTLAIALHVALCTHIIQRGAKSGVKVRVCGPMDSMFSTELARKLRVVTI